ncbi:flagellar hook protein FlgE, partial [Campylobacter sp. RM9939]|nr:flagellar hook protein FlgE [Campylobacter sp. RM9939]
INLVVNKENTAGELWNAVWDDKNNKFTFNQGDTGNNPTITKNKTSLWTADSMTPAEDGKSITLTGKDNVSIITAHKYIYSSSAQDLPPMYNPDGGFNYVQGTGAAGKPTWNGNTDADVGSKNYYDAVHNGALLNTNERVFHSTEDLRELLQRDARYGVDYDGSGTFDSKDVNEAVKVVVNDSGAFSITNPNESSKSPILGNNDPA